MLVLVWWEQGYGGLELEYRRELLYPISIILISFNLSKGQDLPCPVKGVVAVAVADAVARHGGIPELMLNRFRRQRDKGKENKKKEKKKQ